MVRMPKRKASPTSIRNNTLRSTITTTLPLSAVPLPLSAVPLSAVPLPLPLSAEPLPISAVPLPTLPLPLLTLPLPTLPTIVTYASRKDCIDDITQIEMNIGKEIKSSGTKDNGSYKVSLICKDVTCDWKCSYKKKNTGIFCPDLDYNSLKHSSICTSSIYCTNSSTTQLNKDEVLKFEKHYHSLSIEEKIELGDGVIGVAIDEDRNVYATFKLKCLGFSKDENPTYYINNRNCKNQVIIGNDKCACCSDVNHKLKTNRKRKKQEVKSKDLKLLEKQVKKKKTQIVDLRRSKAKVTRQLKNEKVKSDKIKKFLENSHHLDVNNMDEAKSYEMMCKIAFHKLDRYRYSNSNNNKF